MPRLEPCSPLGGDYDKSEGDGTMMPRGRKQKLTLTRGGMRDRIEENLAMIRRKEILYAFSRKLLWALGR